MCFLRLLSLLRKNSLLIFCILILSACQSKIAIEGKKHQNAGEKWLALAQYSSSTLSQYGIKITTKLYVDKSDPNINFVLNDIKLNSKETNFTIDLLSPSFENKYICNPVCIQLVEYSKFSNKDSGTLLSKYFSKHEFELFKFYSDLFILEDKLKSLVSINNQLLDDYLLWLSRNNKPMRTLSGFIKFYSSKLTKNSFEDFIKNPNKHAYVISEVFTEQLDKRSKGLFTAEDQQWTDKPFNSPEKSWLNKPFESPEATWVNSQYSDKIQTISPDDLWITKITTSQVDPSLSKTGNNTLWLELKKLSLEPGDIACTYEGNYFGVVDSISSQQVTITVRGQSKKVADGVIFDADSGELFKSNSIVSFIPKNENKTFSIHDVTRCFIE